MGNVCLLGLPPSVAAAWFGPDQVSSACAIGVFGNQFGIALGFLLPPIFIHDHENKGEIAQDIDNFFYYVGGIMTVFSLLTILFYREKPPLPPTLVRSALLEEPSNYLPSVKRLFKNINFVKLMITYASNAAVYYTMSTVLEQI